MSLTKTETMIMNFRGGDDENYPESFIEIAGKILKNVKTFKYLGCWISYDSHRTSIIEINYRKTSLKNS